jgi:signal peptidase II
MAMANRVRSLEWLGLSAAITVLDLATKHLVQSALAHGEHIPVTPFFDIVLFYNQGAAFSFLAGAGGWQRVFFSLFALIASLFIIRLLYKQPERTLFCLALSLVLGGALGNLYDRLTLGYVVDFLYFHYRGYAWPAFNVADSAIVCGVGLLLWDGYRRAPEDAAG